MKNNLGILVAAAAFGVFGCASNVDDPTADSEAALGTEAARYGGRVRVVTATYGGNAGASYGNATNSVSRACNGYSTCDYLISVNELGDPAYGRRKDFNVQWTCGYGSPLQAHVDAEANGVHVYLSCGGALQVLDATYGGNAGASFGNATNNVAHACDGRSDCDYLVSVNELGDPAYGRRKDFNVRWACGDGAPRRAHLDAEANGRHVYLTCR